MCVATFPKHTRTQKFYRLVPFGIAYFIIRINIHIKVSTYSYIYRAISTGMAGMTMAIPSTARYKKLSNSI